MSLSYTIDHAIATTEVVNVEVAEKSAFSLLGTTVDPKTGESTSVYGIATGDPSYPAKVTYRSALNDRASGKSRRISVTLSTWATETDSISGLDKKYPISGTVSFVIPQGTQVEAADFDDLLGNLFSCMFPSVSSGARNLGYLTKLLFGGSQVA